MLNGRAYVKSTKTANRREAEKIARKYAEDARAEALLGDSEPITLSEAISHYQKAKENTSSKTVRLMEQTV